MFYSHDLLGRKSALGAIWTMAHGKKLSKCKILGINVTDICKQILQPDVPHSLRLQGILIGGVVIVFNKQQIYLLEDLQDMLRKVKAAAAPEPAAAAVANTLLQHGRGKARAEAITLAELDPSELEHQMLVLPAEALGRLADLDDLEGFDEGLDGPLADPHRPAADPHQEGGNGRKKRGAKAAKEAADKAAKGQGPAATGSLGDDLFVVPTLDPNSAGAGGSRGAALDSRGLRDASGSLRPNSASVLPSQHLHTRRTYDLDDDLFEAPDLDLFMDPAHRQTPSMGLGGAARSDPFPEDDLFDAPAMLDEEEEALLGGLGGIAAAAAPAAAVAAAGAAPRRRRAAASGETTADGEEEGQGEEEDLTQAPSALQQQRSASVVPLASVGQPPEHFMPPSPLRDDEDMFPPLFDADGANNLNDGLDGAAGAAADRPAAAGKRRRTSDEDNDSASEMSHLLAASPDKEQPQEAPVRARAARKASKPARRRGAGSKVVIDDPEETLVRANTYRGWTLDSTALLGPRRPGDAAIAAAAAAAAAARRNAAAGDVAGSGLVVVIAAALARGDGDAATAAVLRGPASMLAAPGLAWAPYLRLIVEDAARAGGLRHADDVDTADPDASAAAEAGDKTRAKRQRTGPKGKAAAAQQAQAQSGGQSASEGQQREEASELGPDPWDRPAVFLPREEGLDADMGFNFGMRMEEEEEERSQGAMMFEDDVELERLRREETPNGSGAAAAARALTGGLGLGGLAGAAGLHTGGRSSRATSQTTGSSLGRESETEAGGATGRRALSAGRLSGGRPSLGPLGGLRFGTGALEDLLPAIEETEGAGEGLMAMDLGFGEAAEEDGLLPATMRGAGSDRTLQGRSARLRSGSAPRSGTFTGTATGTTGTGTLGDGTAAFHLKETEAHGTQAPGSSFISRHTRTVITIFRQRLGVLASQLPTQAGAPAQDGSGTALDGSTAAKPCLSFFEMVGRLQRKEAVKLFYQTLVTHNIGFVRAEQDEPYGDIAISAGRYL
ncbi:hypothetical protein HYH03_017665 [Edaphochlamys debaryana]|uniref:Uncharacterized protein n=1 Tax=Edaphochlamys debaryana TaxID=47281 RepID=A0A835XG66_9CHLO|nr:hypothetical protein HYH03_017665 [Edaphochlamys debaryana]|eukprot:KAG2483483.1 hypothetical protein HYH03_017665 [Edaphochlamys debaryana]